MAALKSSRTAQWPLQAEFTFDLSVDTMPTTVGNVIGGAAPVYNAAGVAMGAVATNIFDMLPLPPNATVVGGEVIVETAVVGPTASTLSLGDLNGATRYAATVNLLAAGRTALTLTGYRGVGENVRGTVVNTVAVATAGKVTIRVQYTVQNRANEAQVA